MKTIEFKYELDEKVITPFGDLGIIGMLGFDDGGPQYYVKTSVASNWFKESQLTKKEE